MDHPYRRASAVESPSPPLEARYRLPSLSAFRWRLRLILAPLSLGLAYMVLILVAIVLRSTFPALEALDALYPWSVVKTVALVLIPYAVFYTWWKRRQASGEDSVLARNEAAVALLIGGEVVRASDELEALLASRKLGVFHRTVLVINRGVAFLRSGDVARGRALLEEAVRSRLLEAVGELAPHLAGTHRHLAMCGALVEDLAMATRHLEAARALTPEQKRDELILVEVLVAVVEQRFEEAVDMVDGRWRGAEVHLRPFQLKMLRLLRLFALARLGRLTDDEVARVRVAVEPVTAADLEPHLGHLRGFRELVSGWLTLQR